MIKRTFVLDEQSSANLDRAADRLGIPKSQVVREAIQLYGERMDKLTAEERERALGAFDQGIAVLPERSRDEVQAELDEIRRARRAGGRAGG